MPHSRAPQHQRGATGQLSTEQRATGSSPGSPGRWHSTHVDAAHRGEPIAAQRGKKQSQEPLVQHRRAAERSAAPGRGAWQHDPARSCPAPSRPQLVGTWGTVPHSRAAAARSSRAQHSTAPCPSACKDESSRSRGKEHIGTTARRAGSLPLPALLPQRAKTAAD